MACRAARKALSDAFDPLVLNSSCAGGCSASRRPGSRRSRYRDNTRTRSIARPCCGKARRSSRTARSFPRKMMAALNKGRVKPTPTAASAVNLSRSFPEMSDPSCPISSTVMRCRVKSIRRNRLRSLVATALSRASAPRAPRARSRSDTASAGCFGARARPQASQVIDQAKRQWRRTKSGVFSTHPGQNWKSCRDTHRLE